MPPEVPDPLVPMSSKASYENFLRTQLLLPVPRIFITRTIDVTIRTYVTRALAELEQRGCPAIEVRFDSEGGECFSGLAIYDALRLYVGHTTGVVLGRAASMSAVILQACKVRKCTRHSKVHIHDVRRPTVSLHDLEDDRRRARILGELKKLQDDVDNILVNRTGQKLSAIRKVRRADKPLDADESLAFGLIDEVI